MAGRGGSTFEKRRKEQQRKEKRELKFEQRLQRKKQSSEDKPADPDLNPGAEATELESTSTENADNA